MSKKIKLDVHFEEHENASQLKAESLQLLNQARSNCDKAYAPYSEFYVGAAVLLENGITVDGSNQENIAYPSGLCAERVALFAAATQFPGVTIEKIAISAKKPNETNYRCVTPCGSCRQVISEYQTLHEKPIEIIMEGQQGKILVADSVDMLLPFKFSPESLD